MENTTTKIVQLYLSSRFSPATEEKIQRWLLAPGQEEEKEKASFRYWNSLKTRPTRNTYVSLGKVETRLGIYRKTDKQILSRKWAAVAAILAILVVTGGTYLWYNTGKMSYTEVFAGYGEPKHIELSDGSTAWLNSGTTIRFPEKFTGSQREVYLDGEAYFTVKRESKKPFIVHTGHFNVKALGTVFNLKAYRDEDTSVATLESGKISINTSAGQSQVLLPGQQLSLNHRTLKIDLREVQGEEASAWKDGNLIFTDMTLREILIILGRRFNLLPRLPQVETNTEYTVKFTKDESIEHILNVLSEMSNCTFHLEKNTIIVVPK